MPGAKIAERDSKSAKSVTRLEAGSQSAHDRSWLTQGGESGTTKCRGADA